ncbi:MAG: hypothetical protein RL318_2790 [Fibrobacterota bacterium]
MSDRSSHRTSPNCAFLQNAVTQLLTDATTISASRSITRRRVRSIVVYTKINTHIDPVIDSKRTRLPRERGFPRPERTEARRTRKPKRTSERSVPKRQSHVRRDFRQPEQGSKVRRPWKAQPIPCRPAIPQESENQGRTTPSFCDDTCIPSDCHPFREPFRSRSLLHRIPIQKAC